MPLLLYNASALSHLNNGGGGVSGLDKSSLACDELLELHSFSFVEASIRSNPNDESLENSWSFFSFSCSCITRRSKS